MSDRSDRGFYELVDRVIELANELVAGLGTPRVSAALLFAASRFNAHNFCETDGDRANRDAAIEYYRDEYVKMLRDNFDRLKPLR